MSTAPPWCQREQVKKKTWILGVVLTLLFRLIEIVSDTVFWLIHYNAKPQVLPPITNGLLLESGTSLAEKIRNQKVSSEEVVKTFIARIKEVNPIINCVVDNCFELALDEARKVDKLIQSGTKDAATLEKELPFLGVPFTIKDCFSVKGMRYTAGLVKRRNIVGQFDADVVALMKRAGAIHLAVTNVSELCMWWESHNHVYGRSRNPYDLNRIVGGSSGGEAGILTAAGSPFGIGSDIGGSIRMPAFFCGIFGHKPTRNIVSNYEQQPVAESVLQNFLVTGPMSRSCADLLPMYRILAGENVSKLKLDTKVSVSKLRYFYMDSFGSVPLLSRVHPELKNAQDMVIRHIQKTYNISVKQVQFPKFYHAMEMWLTKMDCGDNPSFSEEITMRNGSKPLVPELLKSFFGWSDHTLAAIVLGLAENFSLPADHPTSRKMITMCDDLLSELQELLGDDGVLFVPPHPTPALYHNQPLTKPLNAAYTAVFNILGLPVTQVPLGLGSWGVPLGVQVVASLHNDHLTLAVAEELEKAFGGWVSPCPVTC